MPITELRIEGLRTIEKLRLKLDGLTVLIGDNGSGKSSILEGCEILRRATGEHFMDELHSIHGGLRALLRQGAPALKLGVTMRPPPSRGPTIKSVEYDLVLTPIGSFAQLEEKIRFTTKARPASKAPGKKRNQPGVRSIPARPAKTRVVVHRDGHFAFDEFEDDEGVHHPAFELHEHEPFLSRPELYRSSSTYDLAARIAATHLRGLTIHLPFETLPSWVARALDRKSALRNSTPLAPASRLERLGLNLANAFHALKNNSKHEEWQRTLSYIRLGLGEHIEDVATLADPSGGSIALSLKLKNLDRQVPASQLSDGMLSYLAFVALFRLSGPDTSLLGFDEPDVHLHPKLLMRVLDMFEAMARDFPVLVATHSDRLLDGLSDPARSVVLCELDSKQTTRLLRPDPLALARWLERYRGIGDLRGAGHEASVLTRKEPA
ncbi:MAG TPA: AAA family ATPase [Myxococcaceae bacterium]|jgi:predicted ATPase